ncbi:hypothetical protein AB0J37_41800 [Microbispora rosea]|uniref:hypothetical protein n=1 Tax=Microbispora rosea TaxID=58117 RepID=UPI003430DC66
MRLALTGPLLASPVLTDAPTGLTLGGSVLTRPALVGPWLARLLIAGTGGGTVGASGTGVRGSIGTGVAPRTGVRRSVGTGMCLSLGFGGVGGVGGVGVGRVGVGGEGFGVDQDEEFGGDLLLEQGDEGIGLAHAQRAVIALRPRLGVGVQQGA